jgi:hypothetical protein
MVVQSRLSALKAGRPSLHAAPPLNAVASLESSSGLWLHDGRWAAHHDARAGHHLKFAPPSWHLPEVMDVFVSQVLAILSDFYQMKPVEGKPRHSIRSATSWLHHMT